MAFPHDGKKFQPGESGNPDGRPRKLKELDAMLEEILGAEKDGVTAAEAILMALRNKATKGDIRAAEVLLERYYGKPKQSMDLNLNAQIPIQIIMPPDEPSPG